MRDGMGINEGQREKYIFPDNFNLMAGYRGGGGGWSGFGQYMRDKTVKLSEQFNCRFTQKSTIFNGLTFWSTGRLEEVDFDLRELITENGGLYEQYGLRNVSHIIASNLALSNHSWKKLLGGKFTKRTFVIVTPNWIIDSITAGRVLPEARYLPECLRSDTSLDGFLQGNISLKRFTDLSKSDSVAVSKDTQFNANRVLRINVAGSFDSLSVKEAICSGFLASSSRLTRRGYVTIKICNSINVFNLDFSDARTCLVDAVIREIEANASLDIKGISICLYEKQPNSASISIFPDDQDEGSTDKHEAITSLITGLLESDEDSLEENLKLIIRTSGPFIEAIILDSIIRFVNLRRLDVVHDSIVQMRKLCRNSPNTVLTSWMDRLISKLTQIFVSDNGGANLLIA